MAYKTFIAGTEGLASDINTYLMNQTVMVFADATARNAALTSPTEGMVTYQEANDHLTIYNGSSWVAYDIGAWQAYTPTFTNITLGTGGTTSFYYQRIGKTIALRGRITLGTGGTFTGAATFSLPVNAILDQQFWYSGGSLVDASASAYYPSSLRVFTSGVQIGALNASGAYVAHALTSATVPFTWTVSDIINVSFTYEGV